MSLSLVTLCPQYTLQFASSTQITFSPLLFHHHSPACHQILFKAKIFIVGRHIMQQKYTPPTHDHWAHPVKAQDVPSDHV